MYVKRIWQFHWYSSLPSRIETGSRPSPQICFTDLRDLTVTYLIQGAGPCWFSGSHTKLTTSPYYKFIANLPLPLCFLHESPITRKIWNSWAARYGSVRSTKASSMWQSIQGGKRQHQSWCKGTLWERNLMNVTKKTQQLQTDSKQKKYLPWISRKTKPSNPSSQQKYCEVSMSKTHVNYGIKATLGLPWSSAGLQYNGMYKNSHLDHLSLHECYCSSQGHPCSITSFL